MATAICFYARIDATSARLSVSGFRADPPAMRHRQISDRLARIERRRAKAAYDPNDLRQGLLSTLHGRLPHGEAVAFVDFLCSMPRDEARAWLVAEIEGRET